MTEILLVRHGQSEWNVQARWQGQLDPPLTDLGRKQAASAAESIGTVEAIFASPLQRAYETALILGRQLGIDEVIALDGLKERAAGGFEGLTRSEIAERFPGYLEDGRRPDGWEDDDALRARALGALIAIGRSVESGSVLAVTHGGVMSRLEAHERGQHRSFPNLGALATVVTRDTVTIRDRVELIDPTPLPTME